MALTSYTQKCTKCDIDKLPEEFYRSSITKSGRQPHCKKCESIIHATWRKNNKDKVAIQNKKNWVKNSNKINVCNKIWSAKNNEKIRQYSKKSYQKNILRHKLSVKNWVKKNTDIVCAYSAKYRASKKHATPKWANEFFIKEIYHLAKIRTKMLEIEFHVDHVVPLQSKLVCGLHVENNLQIISSTNNRSKNNRYWPGMP